MLVFWYTFLMKIPKITSKPKMEKRDKFANELDRIKASFRLEGQNLSEDNIKRCKMVLEHKITVEEAIAQVIRDR